MSCEKRDDLENQRSLDTDDDEILAAHLSLEIATTGAKREVILGYSQEELRDVTLSDDSKVQYERVESLIEAFGFFDSQLSRRDRQKVQSAIESIRELGPQEKTERLNMFNNAAIQNTMVSFIRIVQDEGEPCP